jgi:solute:Na+ symporter, SSS family
VDGYTFIGGVNFGRDLVWRWRREEDESRVNGYVQIGFVITAVVSVALALWFRSAVDLWHDVGSVGVSALLVPLVTSYRADWRARPAFAVASMAAGGAVSLGWLLVARIGGGAYPLGLEPIYPGLVASAVLWAGGRVRHRD